MPASHAEVGFIKRCLDRGMTVDQIQALVKVAADLDEAPIVGSPEPHMSFWSNLFRLSNLLKPAGRRLAEKITPITDQSSQESLAGLGQAFVEGTGSPEGLMGRLSRSIAGRTSYWEPEKLSWLGRLLYGDEQQPALGRKAQLGLADAQAYGDMEEQIKNLYPALGPRALELLTSKVIGPRQAKAHFAAAGGPAKVLKEMPKLYPGYMDEIPGVEKLSSEKLAAVSTSMLNVPSPMLSSEALMSPQTQGGLMTSAVARGRQLLDPSILRKGLPDPLSRVREAEGPLSIPVQAARNLRRGSGWLSRLLQATRLGRLGLGLKASLGAPVSASAGTILPALLTAAAGYGAGHTLSKPVDRLLGGIAGLGVGGEGMLSERLGRQFADVSTGDTLRTTAGTVSNVAGKGIDELRKMFPALGERALQNLASKAQGEGVMNQLRATAGSMLGGKEAAEKSAALPEWFLSYDWYNPGKMTRFLRERSNLDLPAPIYGHTRDVNNLDRVARLFTRAPDRKGKPVRLARMFKGDMPKGLSSGPKSFQEIRTKFPGLLYKKLWETDQPHGIAPLKKVHDRGDMTRLGKLKMILRHPKSTRALSLLDEVLRKPASTRAGTIIPALLTAAAGLGLGRGVSRPIDKLLGGMAGLGVGGEGMLSERLGRQFADVSTGDTLRTTSGTVSDVAGKGIDELRKMFPALGEKALQNLASKAQGEDVMSKLRAAAGSLFGGKEAAEKRAADQLLQAIRDMASGGTVPPPLPRAAGSVSGLGLPALKALPEFARSVTGSTPLPAPEGWIGVPPQYPPFWYRIVPGPARSVSKAVPKGWEHPFKILDRLRESTPEDIHYDKLQRAAHIRKTSGKFSRNAAAKILRLLRKSPHVDTGKAKSLADALVKPVTLSGAYGNAYPAMKASKAALPALITALVAGAAGKGVSRPIDRLLGGVAGLGVGGEGMLSERLGRQFADVSTGDTLKTTSGTLSDVAGKSIDELRKMFPALGEKALKNLASKAQDGGVMDQLRAAAGSLFGSKKASEESIAAGFVSRCIERNISPAGILKLATAAELRGFDGLRGAVRDQLFQVLY